MESGNENHIIATSRSLIAMPVVNEDGFFYLAYVDVRAVRRGQCRPPYKESYVQIVQLFQKK